jgi:protein ImuB
LVAAVDDRAAAAGIAPGMPLADARALAFDLVPRLADPAGDAAALARLAEWCRRYTPLSAVESAAGDAANGAGLWLDITGCAHLFGGEAALMGDLSGRLRRFGYGARAGLADTPGAAWAAARFLREARGEAGGDGAVVAPGTARAVLAPLPVAALRLAPAAVEGLDRLGLRRIGDLYPLPRATLARRFGESVWRRLDQALGRLPEPISPRQPAEPHLARIVLAEPVLHAEGLAAGLERLLATLCRDLDAGQRGARRLVLTLYRVDGSLRRTAIGTSRPNRDPAALGRLFAEHLDRLDPGFGVEVMTLEATVAEPLTALQLVIGRDAGTGRTPQRHGDTEKEETIHLSSPGLTRRSIPPPTQVAPWMRGSSPRMTENSVPLCLGGDSKVETTAIADLVDRLGNRLGFGRVTRLVPRESHLPERAVARLSVTKQAGRGAWQAVPPRQRPLRLLEPAEPVQATALMPDHPPALFRRGPVLHHITHAEGPERLLPEWWHVAVPDADLPPARDYFRVEDAEGRRYWLYREVAAGEAAPRWFLHGLFG